MALNGRSETRLPRWLDGWGAGLVILLFAGSAMWFAFPRAVAPRVVPQPTIDRSALREAERRDDARAVRAVEVPLDVEVRQLGRELRAYNRAAHDGDARALVEARGRIVTVASRAILQGVEPLAELRAYQLLAFLRELRAWERSGRLGSELIELGGDFARTASRSGWCGPDARLLADESTLRSLFKRRWNGIVGIADPALALTLDEDRARFGFLLRYPYAPARTDQSEAEDAGDGVLGLRRAKVRLRVVKGLGKRDPTYPTDFARGVILYDQQRFGEAANAFRAHIARFPGGPYATWAKNHLLAAVGQAGSSPAPPGSGRR
ncbi:MAG: hypothetical protein AAGA56_23580 [Myxococcota bacterium]